MDSLSKYELKALMKQHKGPCVSIFMPTPRAKTLNNPIKFKNLLRETKKDLLETGIRTTTAKELLEPAQKLLRNGTFWRDQSNGLAVFLSPEVSGHYRLPLDFEELVVVTKRFHIKPLLPLFSSSGRFYVLGLSQNEVRLLQCTRYRVNELELEGIPENLADIFHGHGFGTNDDETKLRYFRQIDKGLHKLLRNKRAPLVLAGFDYLFPIYQKANTYPHLIDRGIAGNPEGVRAKELWARALAIVQPHLQKVQRRASAKYRKSASTERASNDIKEIVFAAYHGRIASLFVAIGVQCWGAFDQETNTVHLRQEAKSGDEDLLNLAATQTLLKGGHVYAVEPEDVPDDAPLAAVFR